MAADRDTSIAQLIADLVNDVRTLIRQELALARAELREELGRVLRAAALLAVALGTLAVGCLWLLVALTRAIAAVFIWPLAIVYALVGGILALVAIVLLAVAWGQIRGLRLVPKTRDTLRGVVQSAVPQVSGSK